MSPSTVFNFSRNVGQSKHPTTKIYKKKCNSEIQRYFSLSKMLLIVFVEISKLPRSMFLGVLRDHLWNSQIHITREVLIYPNLKTLRIHCFFRPWEFRVRLFLEIGNFVLGFLNMEIPCWRFLDYRNYVLYFLDIENCVLGFFRFWKFRNCFFCTLEISCLVFLDFGILCLVFGTLAEILDFFCQYKYR